MHAYSAHRWPISSHMHPYSEFLRWPHFSTYASLQYNSELSMDLTVKKSACLLDFTSHYTVLCYNFF